MVGIIFGQLKCVGGGKIPEVEINGLHLDLNEEGYLKN